MKFSGVFLSLHLLSFHSQPSLAYWRMACGISQTSRIDPIVNPGSISGHVHKFAGGINVDQSSTQGSLLTSSCSTCEVQSDKSAYWTPQLYYEHADGTIEEVQNEGMTVYYVGRGGDSSNTVPFPAGFKMISGNTVLRHYDEQDLTYLNTRPIADRETHFIQETNCVNGLRAQLNFQSCWDGVNLYKPDNSHVAYLSGIDYGVCPPTHPVPIPGLFFEVLYWTNRVQRSSGGRFVLSNGDTTGFSFHGDFLNGWDQDDQIQAVRECLYTDNGGTVSACPILARSATADFARTCPESAQVLSETVRGVLPNRSLPGCNPITPGPANAPQVVCAVNSSSPVSTLPTILPTPSTTFATNTSEARTSPIQTTSNQQFDPQNSTVSTTTIFEPIRSSDTPRTFPFTNSSSTRQNSGGVFVTVSSANATPNLTTAQPFVVILTDVATMTVTVPSSTNRNLTTSSSGTIGLNLTNSIRTSSLVATTVATNLTTSADADPVTQTAFVTVYSPVTINVTSVTNVTVAPTTLLKRHTRPDSVTFRIKGRQVVRS